MKSLIDAGNKITEIILECERDLHDLPHTVGRISTEVKIHGSPIPTQIILDLVDEFIDTRREKKKLQGMQGFDEKELEVAFNKLSRKWGGQDVN